MPDAKIAKNSPSARHRTTWKGHNFATKAHIDNRKNELVKQQYLLHMHLQYAELLPTNGLDLLASLGTPANFNGFRVLTALLHGTVVVGVSQTLRRWTDHATYIRQGDHHVGPILAHILVNASAAIAAEVNVLSSKIWSGIKNSLFFVFLRVLFDAFILSFL